MNYLAQLRSEASEKAVSAWFEQNPPLAMRGIDESTWNALCSSVYPGAKSDSILMAIDYCRARNLDIMLKPVHLVPMSIKNAQTGNNEYRDVPMPGVGLYRIQADRTGNYAGADAPDMGPEVTKTFTSKDGKPVEVTFPEWCKYTVHKLIGDRIVSYTALEYWEENYATDSKYSTAPNSMWLKRPRGQLAKCAEAQALRKGWPEIGQEPTAEEMEGKAFERDITPRPQASQQPEALPFYPTDKFNKKISIWQEQVGSGSRTAVDVINTLSSRYTLSAEQIKSLKSCEVSA
jgi:phage recombination protein Bet